ncbi:MAG: hypothetical protein HY675_07170 [Chloroflexi bacterium]|nr:hypothetical protein [Chloroflexota bacterium]
MRLGFDATGRWPIVLISLAEAGTTLLAFVEPISVVYVDFFVLAVLLAAIFYGYRGAVVVSLLSTAIAIVLGLLIHQSASTAVLLLRTLLYLCVGYAVALLYQSYLRHTQALGALRERNAQLIETIEHATRSNSALADENARLRNAKELTMDFVGGIAHDLRSSLAAIKGSAQTLVRLGDKLNTAKRGDLLQGVIGGVNQCLNTVENLFDASMVEAGHFQVDPKETDLPKLVGDCLRMFAGSLGNRVINVEVPVGVPSVQADAENVSQVLVNLLGNAIKYSPGKANITVKIEPMESFVRVSVRDMGIGIAPEDLEHIFDRYFRSQDRRVRRAKGAGLGLAISREIICAHGGEIEAKSEPGKGSTFSFTLPVATSGSRSRDDLGRDRESARLDGSQVGDRQAPRDRGQQVA